MLFIPLPTGEARLYNLEGQSDAPLPAGVIEREVQCKTMHMEKIVVTNWLKKPQKFKVARSFQIEPGIIIKGLDDIDIPPQVLPNHPTPATPRCPWYPVWYPLYPV